MTRLLHVALLLVLLTASAANAGTPVATGTGGGAATISEQATQSAIAVLDRGGNAVDAAVAAAATLGITDPFSCGIGGGGFMVVYLAKEQRVVTLDHRETAPAAATPDLFTEGGRDVGLRRFVPAAGNDEDREGQQRNDAVHPVQAHGNSEAAWQWPAVPARLPTPGTAHRGWTTSFHVRIGHRERARVACLARVTIGSPAFR